MQDRSGPAPAKRAPRRRRRKEARPSEIIDAAMRLWSERGFAATRLEDVAAEAGISKGTIYLYFPSKEALFEAAVESRLIGTIAKVEEAGHDIEGGTEDLLRFALSSMKGQLLDAGGAVFLKIMVAEGHRFPEMVERYRLSILTRGMTAIRAILTRGVARGELREGADRIDPRLLISPMLMAAVWEMVFRGVDPPDRDALIETQVAMVMDGLRRR